MNNTSEKPKKFILTYEDITETLHKRLPEIREWNPDIIFAVMRGGMTMAHWLGRQLNKPVHAINVDHGAANFITLPDNERKVLIVEDLIANGRTFRLVRSLMDRYIPRSKWYFMPFVLDDSFDPKPYAEIRWWSHQTFDWVIFPWEDEQAVKIGDRGLFREGTDCYGR